MPRRCARTPPPTRPARGSRACSRAGAACCRSSRSPFDFAAIACPVMLVWGTRDHMVPHRGARVLTGAHPATRLELLDGCGHCPQLEMPERLGELLAGFPEPALALAA